MASKCNFSRPLVADLLDVYHTGDYWLIPARVATGKIEWPHKLDEKGAVVRDSQGNEHPRHCRRMASNTIMRRWL